MKKTYKTSGLVKEITRLSPNFSFVTLVTLEMGFNEEKISVYTGLGDYYLGKWIDITLQESGVFHKRVKQRIEGLMRKEHIEMPYSDLEKIDEDCLAKIFL